MRIDFDNWMPITVTEVNDIFNPIPVIWFIAGGWALDLHVRKETRKHSDIDIVIFRDRKKVLYEFLKQDWTLYKAQNGTLQPWKEGEFLTSINGVWVSKNTDSPWAFQIMLVDSEKKEWIYRREVSIKRAINMIFSRTSEEIPYIKPEIQLLYKGISSKIREKDIIDFQNILPFLVSKEKAWLKTSLNKQFPEGHGWLEYL